MTSSFQLRQQLSDGPEDLMPCPVCSWLDHPEMACGDIIKGPDIFLARANRRTMVTTCCRFSEPLFAFRGQTRSEIAAPWRGIVKKAMEAPHGKMLTTLGKLARRGLVPSEIVKLLPKEA